MAFRTRIDAGVVERRLGIDADGAVVDDGFRPRETEALVGYRSKLERGRGAPSAHHDFEAHGFEAQLRELAGILHILVELQFTTNMNVQMNLSLMRGLYVPGLSTRLLSIESIISRGDWGGAD